MRRSLALTVALLAAMALGRVITDHVPIGSVNDDSFVRSGRVGHTMSLRYADLTVTDVRSPAFLGSVGGSAVAPGGRFLAVYATVVAKRHPQRVQYAALTGGDGRTYAATSRGYCSGIEFTAPTRVPYHVMYCFDLPRSAIAGSSLVFSLGAPGSDGGQARDDVAHVDLRIDRARAASLTKVTTGLDGFVGGLGTADLKPLTLKGTS